MEYNSVGIPRGTEAGLHYKRFSLFLSGVTVSRASLRQMRSLDRVYPFKSPPPKHLAAVVPLRVTGI